MSDKPPILKSKSVMITSATTVFGLIYKIVDAAGNAEYLWQKLGISAETAQFLGSPRTIDVFVALSMLALVLSLLYQVNRVIAFGAGQSVATQSVTAQPEAAQPKAEKTEKAGAQESQATTRDGRIIVGVTPEYLAGFYKEHTMMQAARLAAPFIGKWMKISGDVRNVGTSNMILFERPDGWLLVIAAFNEKWADHLSVIRRGDHVIVLGQIKEVNSGDIRLENCEIIDS